MAVSAAYRSRQVHRKRIGEVFAWVKAIAGLSKTRYRGLARADWQFTLALVWRQRLWDRLRVFDKRGFPAHRRE